VNKRDKRDKRAKRAIIHEACDIIETGVSVWSCHAIDRAGRRFDVTDSESTWQARKIKAEYAAFYDKDPTEPWGFEQLMFDMFDMGLTYEEGKALQRSARIIAMLFFLEVTANAY
jgi:hypothetical protein